jgi:hypothetical protein
MSRTISIEPALVPSIARPYLSLRTRWISGSLMNETFSPPRYPLTTTALLLPPPPLPESPPRTSVKTRAATMTTASRPAPSNCRGFIGWVSSA